MFCHERTSDASLTFLANVHTNRTFHWKVAMKVVSFDMGLLNGATRLSNRYHYNERISSSRMLCTTSICLDCLTDTSVSMRVVLSFCAAHSCDENTTLSMCCRKRTTQTVPRDVNAAKRISSLNAFDSDSCRRYAWHRRSALVLIPIIGTVNTPINQNDLLHAERVAPPHYMASLPG